MEISLIHINSVLKYCFVCSGFIQLLGASQTSTFQSNNNLRSKHNIHIISKTCLDDWSKRYTILLIQIIMLEKADWLMSSDHTSLLPLSKVRSLSVMNA